MMSYHQAEQNDQAVTKERNAVTLARHYHVPVSQTTTGMFANRAGHQVQTR